MSKDEELPELDIPDDDDDGAPSKSSKSIFEKPSAKQSEKRQSQGSVSLKSEEGPDSDGQPSTEEAASVERPDSGAPWDEERDEEDEEYEGGTAAGSWYSGTLPSAWEEYGEIPSVTSSEVQDGQHPSIPPSASTDEDQLGEGAEGVEERILEDVSSGKGSPKKSGVESDLSVPEYIIEEGLSEEEEEDMYLEDMAGGLVDEMVTGEKPVGRRGSRGVAEGVIEDAAFGDSSEAVAEGVVSGVMPHPVKMVENIISDTISPEYQAQQVVDRLMPGREETAEGIADKMVSLIVSGEDMDEDVTQYIWEGPCSSTSSSGKSDEDMGKFDRETCLEQYKNLWKEKFIISRKNVFLQKKMYEYYKRKMLIRYFESIQDDQKAEAKFIKDIKEFEEFINEDRNRRAVISMELVDLEKRKDECDIRLRESLSFLIEGEREHGTGLINENGKLLLDKTVDRLLRRQKETVNELVGILQKYIRIRDFLSSKEKALVQLETIGINCYLRDYEQLQMENQSYSDKIEERDEELMRLRQDATASMQILAHVREKANATTNSIFDLHESLESVMMVLGEIREHISSLKKVREKLRVKTQQMKCDSGLLVQQRLVKDFQDSINESVRLENETERLRQQFYSRNDNLIIMRRKSERRRSMHVSPTERERDYQIFKELLHHKRRDMPREEVSKKKARSASVYSSYRGDGDDGDDQRRISKVKALKKSRPNFFPTKKFDSYIR